VNHRLFISAVLRRVDAEHQLVPVHLELGRNGWTVAFLSLPDGINDRGAAGGQLQHELSVVSMLSGRGPATLQSNPVAATTSI